LRTRTKICGITCVEDALAAVQAGADAIGLVFYPPSPRYIAPEKAALIVAKLPPFVDAVGLFVDANAVEVRSVLAKVRLDLLQFHGDEASAYCDSFSIPYIKAVRVRPELNLVEYAARYGGAKALLLDAYLEGIAGGTGERFDWNLIPASLPKPLILAGGLTPKYVREAIRQVSPYAVDVSGGVERKKGIKDAEKIAAFIRETGVSHG
jgi:phosphoribosylanthranilate isomerase